MCEAEAPDVFQVTDDGSVLVLDAATGPQLRDELLAAVAACPTGALSLVETEQAPLGR
jgi:ferredoxin